MTASFTASRYHRREVQHPAIRAYVGYIRSPYLVGELDGFILEEVRVLPIGVPGGPCRPEHRNKSFYAKNIVKGPYNPFRRPGASFLQ